MPCVLCRIYRVEAVYPHRNSIYYVLWAADTHEIPGLVFGEVRQLPLRCFVHLFLCLPDAQPSECQPIETEAVRTEPDETEQES